MQHDPPQDRITGQPQDMGGGIVRLLAPNPSPMTERGTNTYLVGRGGGTAIIDPGPDDDRHLAAILGAVGPDRHVSHIFVTHAHLDHSALVPRLARETGAPVLAFGPPMAGRSAAMQALVHAGMTGGGEGVDHAFRPDRTLGDGESISGDGWQITAHWTPGHFCNHLCFQTGDTVFSGDLVMGWASTLISPPDGDLGNFMSSCARLRALRAGRLLPGHGTAVDKPEQRIDWLVAHRRTREADILDALGPTPQTPAQLAATIYTDTPPALMPAATRNVLAHLIDLHRRGQVETKAPPGPHSTFARAQTVAHKA